MIGVIADQVSEEHVLVHGHAMQQACALGMVMPCFSTNIFERLDVMQYHACTACPGTVLAWNALMVKMVCTAQSCPAVLIVVPCHPKVLPGISVA